MGAAASSGAGSRPAWTVVLGTLILLAGTLVYANSLDGVFLFDDKSAIVNNETIRALDRPWRVLSPPADTTVAGRPLVNATLAVNYALGGLSVRGYHAVNVGIHLLAALTMFSLVRRSLERISTVSYATPVAFATALLWTVHPLQTSAVTYVVQRAECLASLFTLVTLDCVARAERTTHPRRWHAAAIAACTLGVLSKEVAAVAPLLVLAWHWIFTGASLGRILRRNRWLYLGLCATWLVPAWVAFGVRTRSVGFGFEEYPPFDYLKIQARAVLHYLRLCVWPHPLALDYGWPPVPSLWEALRPGLAVLGLVALSAVAVFRRHPLGFAGACFFLVLAPTSSFLPIVTEVVAEHRVYLPLGAVLATVAAAGAALLERAGRRAVLVAGAPLLLIACVVSGWRTIERNTVYHSARAPWEDVLAHDPEVARAHYNLGVALEAERDAVGARRHYEEALRLRPGYAKAHNNLAVLLEAAGRADQAERHYRQALSHEPLLATAHHNLGALLGRRGRFEEAVAHLERAVRLEPRYWKAHVNLAIGYGQIGRLDDAVRQFRSALAVDAARAADSHYHFGAMLERTGRSAAARRHFEEALRLDPGHAASRGRLAGATEVSIGDFSNAPDR